MRVYSGPRDMRGVEDRLDIDSDIVVIFIVQDRGNNFIGKFFQNGGSSEGGEVSLLEV